MSWMIQIERTTLKQLLEVRDSLETRIALLAAEKATKEQLVQFGDLWQERVRIALLEAPEGAFILTHLK